MILKNTRLRNNLQKIARSSEIDDIILFGSVVKGKERPNDIDILVIFKNKINKEVEYKVRKTIEKEYQNVQIISKTNATVLEETFVARESLLFEGVSLLSRNKVSDRYGFDSLGLFKYTFDNWTKLQKTKFYYALNGRGGNEGLSQKLNLIKLSDGLLLSPLGNIEKLKEFLESWEIRYIYIPFLLPKRLNKKKLLS